MKRGPLLTAFTLLVLVVAGGWTAWWFFLATYVERLAAAYGGEGAQPRLEYASAERFGFPFTVGFVLKDARLSGPVAGGAGRVTSTRAILSARPWRPGDVHLELPEGAGFGRVGGAPEDRVIGEARSGRGAFVGEPAQTITLDLEDLVIRVGAASPMEVERAGLVWRLPEGEPQEVEFGLAEVTLDPNALFGPKASLAEGRFRLHGPPLTSSRPAEIAAWRAAGGKVEILDAKVDWGALDLEARGALGLDDAYRLAGEVRLRLRNGVAAVKRIEVLGLLTPEAATAAKALVAFASLGGGGSAAAPLTFADGVAKLGAVRVGRLQPICACP